MKLRTGLLTVFTLLIIAGATSCTKDFICQCEVSYSGAPGLPDTLINEYNLKNTEKKAKQICEGGSSTHEEDGIKTVENCHLF